MKDAHRLHSVIKPGIVTMTLMLILTSLTVSISLYAEYQKYLNAYQVAQTKEIDVVKHKEAALIKEFTKVLRLTGSRIEATDSNLERLQKIIASLTHLTIHQVPVSFQTVSYHQISEPQRFITRLGVRASDRIYAPSELSQKEKITFWRDDILLGRLPVTKSGYVEGVLEVRIYRSSLNAYFGPQSKITVFVKDGDIHFDSKPALNFWRFAKENKHQFTIFGSLAFALLLMLACAIVMTLRIVQNRYVQQVQDLEESLTFSEQEADELKEELSESKKTVKSLQISRQLHTKLEGAIRKRQKERAKWITQSLDVVSQSYQNPNFYLPEQDQIDIIHECQKETKFLSLGLSMPQEKEEVDLKKIICCMLQLFDDKTHKSNISLDIDLPEDSCTIQGDPLLMEILFMDVLGKAIHRVPKNGVVSISLKEDENYIHLETLDNGYASTGPTDKLIKKSFDLFLNDDSFLDICRENGLKFIHKKETNGLNASRLILPIQEEEVAKNNVVNLFNT